MDPLKGTPSKVIYMGRPHPKFERGIPFSSLQVCKTAREQIVNKGYLKYVAIACINNLAFITILTDEKRKFNQVSRMKTIWETPEKRLNLKACGCLYPDSRLFRESLLASYECL